jgi:hypothetical protein
LSKFGLTPPAPETEAHENSNFEDSYVEDKFAIMLSKAEKPFGLGAFHMGPKPLDDKPPSSSGRGLHYTTDGSSVDAWVWHAASGSNTAQCDYNRIGAPAAPSTDQLIGRTAYKGGYLSDPAQITVTDNFVRPDPVAHPDQVIPVRLPKDLAATVAAMGPIDLDADHGDSDGAVGASLAMNRFLTRWLPTCRSPLERSFPACSRQSPTWLPNRFAVLPAGRPGDGR